MGKDSKTKPVVVGGAKVGYGGGNLKMGEEKRVGYGCAGFGAWNEDGFGC